MSFRSSVSLSLTCLVVSALPTVGVVAQDGNAAQGIKPAVVTTEMSDEELMKNASLILFYRQVAQMKLQLKSDGIELDTESALEGARRALAGEEVGVPMDKIQSVMSQMQTKVMAIQAKKQKEMEAQLKELDAANKMEGEKYLAENAKKEGVKTLDGGVQYEVMVAGTGPKPKPTDKVRINYHGTFIDGKVFDSTVTPPDPRRQPMPYDSSASGFVNGFNTAIQAMPVGSKWKISIPSEQAYKMGRPGMPPNKTLIFEVELLDILTEKAAAPAGK